MKLPIGNAQAVVVEYFDSVILPAASAAGGMAPFAAGMAGGLIARRTPQMMEQYAPTLKALGVLDADGKLDIDLLYEEAVKALDKGPVIVAGYRADRGDLDKLKNIMEKYGG
nr:MAG TPA: hypothetical protein [Caudoviricetes sp.]